MLMQCNQCVATMINGVLCHETGCPNANSRYDKENEMWIPQYECYWCADKVDEGEVCSCLCPEEEE